MSLHKKLYHSLKGAGERAKANREEQKHKPLPKRHFDERKESQPRTETATKKYEYKHMFKHEEPLNKGQPVKLSYSQKAKRLRPDLTPKQKREHELNKEATEKQLMFEDAKKRQSARTNRNKGVES